MFKSTEQSILFVVVLRTLHVEILIEGGTLFNMIWIQRAGLVVGVF
jgi:hypothetical protein